MDRRELERLRARLNKTKTELARDEGALAHLMNELEDEGFSSIEELEVEIGRLEEELKKLKKTFDKATEDLRRKLEEIYDE